MITTGMYYQWRRTVPSEDAFALAWEEVNSCRPPLLDKLVPTHAPDTETAAATIVQWLGSPVGLGFLAGVIEGSPEVASYLEHALHEARQKRRFTRPEDQPFSLDKALEDEVKPIENDLFWEAVVGRPAGHPDNPW